ncbi:hypothetical protein VDG1235_3958 [Verrucomicrobiia bacterium DG1235]|nr:hypothetical protein VDG1235_3958 [Verrucomicrobiae bacterium DG1235]
MAKLRIFVSSTCYDLDVVRSELRPFITALGYDPVMSDYSDVLYDPRSHTHDSCIKEVPNCDMVVLIIGSRFGGTGIPALLKEFDFDALRSLSSKPELLDSKEKLSITQLEILKAAEQSIPVYAFVDDRVLHDHHVYEKNKSKPTVMEEIEFPSIQKKESAKYIFEFINFLTHRTSNNSITSFSRLEDIKSHLLSQWSQLFQRILSENRKRTIESKRYLDFSERIDDLKAVVMASIATPNLRDTARGALQYRHLITFLSAFRTSNLRDLLLSEKDWDSVLKELGITDIRQSNSSEGYRNETFLIHEDGTFYRSRYSLRMFEDIKVDWSQFTQIEKDSRAAIVEASLEDRDKMRHRAIFHVNKGFEEYMSEQSNQESHQTDDEG